MIKAFLFDMDGVIYNSMPYHAYAWHKAMDEYGIHMSESDAYKYEGMRGLETIKILAKDQNIAIPSNDKVKEMYERKSNIFATFPFPEQIEGVYDLMTELKERGIKICIVTGSGQNNVLNRICKDFEGLIHKDLMVTSHDVQHGKPQPDPYLMGIQKVGASAEECIVVENAPMGVKAGKAAGCYTIAVNTGPLPNSILEDAGADVVFKTMKELQNNLSRLLTIENNNVKI